MSTHGRSPMRRAAGAVLAVVMVVGACTGDDGAGPSTTLPPPSTTPSGDGNGTGSTARLFGVRLSEGTAVGEPAAPVAVVDGTPLTPEQRDAVLARLSAWTDDGSSAEPFNWPTESIAPPRPGTTVDVPFPPAEEIGPPQPMSGPLHVLRYQPEGEVAIAPFVTVTFDQPMVPVTTVGQLDAVDVPATIEPAIAGRWQWIGTRTLRFDATGGAADRLPMATEYRVTVPAGTTSATGGVLAQAVSFTFRTPPVTVTSFQPTGESLGLTPVFVATFDQQVDPAAVLGTVKVTAGGRTWPVRLATDAEVQADDLARSVTSVAVAGRWLAFRPVEPFPVDAALVVSVGPGTPSAEGPRSTGKAVRYEGRTYAALKVVRTECGYGGKCRPGMPISVVLSNPLDPSTFDPGSVGVEPAVPGVSVGVQGNSVVVQGATAGRTTYRITVPAGLTDVFGQRLGRAEKVEVRVDDALDTLTPFASSFTTLDPLAGRLQLPVLTVNHDEVRVRLFTVAPTDWPAYLRYVSQRLGSDDPGLPPGRLIADQTLRIEGERDRVTETAIDLSRAFPEGRGHVVVLVEPTRTYARDSEEYWANRPTATWAQATAIGLDASSDERELVAWTTDLRTGAPLAGVQVQGLVGGPAVTTAADGVGRTTLTSSATPALVATLGDDVALLPAGFWDGSSGWARVQPADQAAWYVFTDRGVYRPGETVSLKGWVRRVGLATDGRLALLGRGVRVTYVVTDPQGAQLTTGTADVNALGGFDLSFALPAGANLGYGSILFTLEGAGALSLATYGAPVRIEEFRRPEFEAVTRPESAGPYTSRQPATVAVDATYYAGGPVADAPVTWQVSTAAATYSPPGWDQFTFGEWVPWWYDTRGYGMFDEGYGRGWPPTPTQVEQFAGVTDSGGHHYLRLDFESTDGGYPDLPVSVSAQATVEDVNRQAWSSTTSLLVHPADYYVGLRSARTFVRQGEAMDLDVVVTDIDGTAVAGRRVSVTAARNEWVFTKGQWTETEADPQTCEVTSAAQPVTCSFTVGAGGRYTVRAVVTDDRGGRSRTELSRWVSGADTRPSRAVEQESLTVVPDRAEYRPGDTAELLVSSPFAQGEGLAVVTRHGIRSVERFTLTDGAAVVRIPVEDADIPRLDVSLEVVGTAPRLADDGTPLPQAPARPAFATGSLSLDVPAVSRTLTVDVTPRDRALEPGGTTAVDVRVRDSSGAPVVGAELAVVVVDEAVLALTGYRLTDPLSVFYAASPTYLSTLYGRQSIVLANPQDLNGGDGGSRETTAAAATTSAPASDEAGGEGAPVPGITDGGNKDGYVPGQGTANPIDERTNFDALAVFAPAVPTGADGRAMVQVPLPDNLTRYRVMVVAVSGADRFGTGESNITARLPLMVRPSAPRFLNFGDALELPVVLQNQTDSVMDVDVVLQTANLTATDSVPGRRVSVPANDRIEVRFPVTTNNAGTARFRVAAVSGGDADATTVELPVYTPATAEAFATYGVIDAGATAQPLQAPTGVVPQFGGLEITTSSTALAGLTDAVLYLAHYPYDSADAYASRIMAVTALRDVLAAFAADGLPTPAEFDATTKADIAALVALQQGDGGFGWWSGAVRSDPYVTVQATHALVLARAAGLSVPRNTLEAALGYLGSIEQRLPDAYSQETKDTVTAYALFVRSLAGDRDAGAARTLWRQRGEKLPLDAVAWLWPVVDDATVDAAIERLVQNRAVETAASANFTTAARDDAYVVLQSDRRTDGLLLDALITRRPQSDLIPKVVNGLLANRTAGRWDNVQENAFILLALRHYWDTYETATPQFVARVWLGDRYAGGASFSGRTTDRQRLALPMSDVLTLGDTNLLVGKDGSGRLYYRIGLRYAADDLRLDPLDRGFTVTRTYEAVDDPADVVRRPDGTWQIAAGARVRVRLTLVAESQRTHVALIDPLPAGLEIVNPDLAVSASLPPEEGRPIPLPADAWFPWYTTWFDHQNLRDDRAEAFAQFLPGGVYQYTYVARATTPGTFVVPPTRAEEIYAPETFGRAATDTVVVA